MVAAVMLFSQALLLAHSHNRDPVQPQNASCFICLAAQNMSPALPNAQPETGTEMVHSFVAAETPPPPHSATTPTARQRSPPFAA
jgi:hypothetical protein